MSPCNPSPPQMYPRSALERPGTQNPKFQTVTKDQILVQDHTFRNFRATRWGSYPRGKRYPRPGFETRRNRKHVPKVSLSLTTAITTARTFTESPTASTQLPSETRTRYESGCLSITSARATTPIKVGYALGDPISRSNCPMACQILNLKKIYRGGSEIELVKEDNSTQPHTDTHTFHADIVWAFVRNPAD